MSNFNVFLEELGHEYPKHVGNNFISTNYGRPIRITLKTGIVFGVLWFRWEHQSDEELQNQILCFNSGNRDIDKVKIKFSDISEAKWN